MGAERDLKIHKTAPETRLASSLSAVEIFTYYTTENYKV